MKQFEQFKAAELFLSERGRGRAVDVGRERNAREVARRVRLEPTLEIRYSSDPSSSAECASSVGRSVSSRAVMCLAGEMSTG
jgi:hypothetical protein